MLGNRDGIDNWQSIPVHLRHSAGRQITPACPARWRILKEIEVQINRSFKGQGDSWSSRGADHLAYHSAFRAIPMLGITGRTKPL
jgi:hypothetical protein